MTPGAGAEPLAQARDLLAAGRPGAAKAALLEVLGRQGPSPRAHLLLARIEHALGNPREQAAALERALAAGADGAAILAALGRARLALQDAAGARRAVDDLETRFPEDAAGHLLAGHVHKALGNVEQARTAYARALALEPALGEALYGLVDLAPDDPDGTLARLAEDLSSRADVPTPDRVNAAFAQARLLDRAGDYEGAMSRLVRANDLARADQARRGVVYRGDVVENRVSEAIDHYPAATFATSLPALDVGLTPIFVLGLPRSGTSLVEQILASHPDVQGAGELDAAHRSHRHFQAERHAAGRSGAVDPRHPEDAALLEAARERYLDALFERDLEGPWVVDKLPANFQIAGHLRAMFPAAPLVHTIRDPRATGYSLYAANFAAHEPYYHDLADLAHYVGQYRRLMAHWRSVLPGPFVEVAYEELARHPDAAIPALLARLGIPMHPDCLAFHRRQAPVLTASHAQVRRPMYTHAIDHWRRYLPWLGPVAALADDA